ncbi:hypothetical protein LXL04_026949 [Taraxacum kok-saghyz]
MNNVSFSCMHPYNMSTVGRWIDAIVRRKVKLLDLSFCVDDKNDDFKLPHCLVTCGSLEVLKFSLNGDCLSFPNFTGLSALRVLQLEGCKFLNYDLVHNFLKSLTLLEDLSLIGCETHDFLNFSISCPNLKNLRIDSRESVDMVYELCYHLEICCPNLVFLEIDGFMSKEIILESLDSLKKVVIHPEETFEWSGKAACDLFAGFFHVEYLSLHIGVIEEEFYFENPSKSLPNLKTLELITTIEDPDYLDVLIRILTCSPILESFHLILENVIKRDMKKSKQVNASELEDSVDRISNLPDPILHLILSHLPTTEEAIQTSILSTRWRYLWTSVHSLHITDYRSRTNPLIEFNKNKFEEFVCQVLEINSIDLDTVSLSFMQLYKMSTVGRWIDAIVSRKVKLLDLHFSVEDDIDDFKLPHCLVTCESLEVLKFSFGGNCLSFPKFTGFSALRVLELEGCKFLNYDLVHNYLKSLTLLEDLSLIGCRTYDFDTFSISCPNLKNLRIDCREWFYNVYELCDRLEISCPKLVFLEIVGFMSKEIILESLDSLEKVVIHPESFVWSGKFVCDLFDGISHVESLSLDIGVIEEEFYFENLPKSLPNLKTLGLITTIDDTNQVDVVIQILTCSPNLESFDLIIKKALFSKYPDESPDFDILKKECSFERLKIINVKGLSADEEAIGFIEFLLERTPFLETISITPRVNMSNELFKSLVESVEILGFRASVKPEIIFVQDHV